MESLIRQPRNDRTSSARVVGLISVAVLGMIAACSMVLQANQTHQALLSTFSEVDSIRSVFVQWKLEQGKEYETIEEEMFRFEIFKQNYLSMLEFNAQGHSSTQGLNQFSDMTKEEFQARFLNIEPEIQESVEFNEYFGSDVLPTTWDWRTRGVVSPVINQGTCSATWVFAPLWSIESYYAIKHLFKLTVLSAQQVIDCNFRNQRCSGGGSPTTTFQYAVMKGLEPESDYPYTGRDGQCNYDESLALTVISGYQTLPTKRPDLLQNAVFVTPAMVYVDGSDSVFQNYAGGVITQGCGSNLNHLLTVVGWTQINGVDAWICKNSWGTNWGDNGYVYIAMDKTANNGAGVCGIYEIDMIPV